MTTFVLNEKYNPEGSQLRKAQLRMLELLVFIDEVCRKNDIPYWLDSGTLLGAMRHGGFIPWDDDADICILRSDAERLEKIMMTEYNDADDYLLLQGEGSFVKVATDCFVVFFPEDAHMPGVNVKPVQVKKIVVKVPVA